MGSLGEGSQPPDGVETELARLADLPVAEHVDVFTAVHQRLAEALSGQLDDQLDHVPDHQQRSP